MRNIHFDSRDDHSNWTLSQVQNDQEAFNSNVERIRSIISNINSPPRKLRFQRTMRDFLQEFQDKPINEARRERRMSQENDPIRMAENEARREHRMSQENDPIRMAENEARRQRRMSQENDSIRTAENVARRESYVSMVRQYTTQLEDDRKNLRECLESVANGQQLALPLEMHDSVNRGSNDFVSQQFNDYLVLCTDCSERWWPDTKNTGNLYSCNQCKKDKKNCDNSRFSYLNDMDPLIPKDFTKRAQFRQEYYTLLETCPLTAIEESLISRRTVVMQAYRLKGGQQAFSGNVISFPQRTSDLVKTLPRLFKDLKWITVRFKKSGDPSDYKDFKVRRNNVRQWLIFLIKWSPAYHDVEISESNFSLLPEDDSVFHELDKLGGSSIVNHEATEQSDSEEEEEDGIADGPQETGTIDILESSVGQEDNIQNELSILVDAIQENEEHIDWPEREETPVNEHTDSLLLASAFPTLFPCGTSDVTCNLNRRDRVTFNEAITHYIKYYDPVRKSYPFAKNSRFLHFIQDVDERHRIQSQASVYMQKNPEDANLTIGDLRGLVKNHNDPSAFIIQNKMQRFGANITGSAAYMNTRKKELTALFEQEGTASLWFTLTMPNWMWKDLHHLFGDPPIQEEEEEEDTLAYEKRCEKEARKKYFENPHIVNEFFIRRVERFVDFYFGPNCLDSLWTWYRFEWQKRGNIHAHGMTRLKCDPGFTKLAKMVLDGRKALKALEFIFNFKLTDNTDQNVIKLLENLTTSFQHQNQVNDISLDPDLMEMLISVTEIDYQFVKGLENIYIIGEEAAKKIINFRDYVITNNNPANPLPADANQSEREPALDRTSGIHPCSTFHTGFSDGEFSVRGQIHETKYANLVDWCQRHRHSQSYCMRLKGKEFKCRFDFPRPIIDKTMVVVQDVLNKNGKIRKTIVKFVFCTNDGWVNSNSKIGLSTWGANMDIALLIDSETIIEYIAKYCNKVEKPSSAFRDIVQKGLKQQQEDTTSNTKNILRKAFNRIAGRRDKCIMEVAHLILSSPYVVCSHAFQLVNLTSTTRKVNLGGNEEELATTKNLVDMYAERMNQAV